MGQTVRRGDSWALPERPTPLLPSKNEGPCLQPVPSNRQLGRNRNGEGQGVSELNWARLAGSMVDTGTKTGDKQQVQKLEGQKQKLKPDSAPHQSLQHLQALFFLKSSNKNPSKHC